MHHYKIDVLFLLDSQVTNKQAITYSLRQHLPSGSTILHSPFSDNDAKAGGQTIIIAPTWSGALTHVWHDPTHLGLLSEVSLLSGTQQIKLYGTYWPYHNDSKHSLETAVKKKLILTEHIQD
jgi:hypothetical protein